MSNSLPTTALTPSIGSLDAYILYVNQIPMLSLAEEQEYAERLQKDGDVESARRLVLAHLRYVVRVARAYMGYGLALNDLIQEGNLGLMKAVKRFDPSVGVRLVSFAVHWIKAEIHEFVLKNWRIVKIATTKSQRKLFFNLRQMKDHSGWLSEAEIAKVSNQLEVSPEEVSRMEQRLYSMDTSFDPLVSESDDESYKSPAQYLYDTTQDPAYLIEKEQVGERGKEELYAALACLDERAQQILQRRWFAEDKATLHELADEYGVSAERIRQLEKNALKKLRQHME